MENRLELSEGIPYLIAATARSISNTATRAFQNAGYNITFEQWAMLASLWNQDGQCQHEIGSCQGKDRPTISRLVDNLEKNNLVVRVPSEHDKRIKRVYLTYQTKQIMPRLMEIYELVVQQAKHKLNESDLQICQRVLSGLQQNLLKIN
jgi:DNA-binding MarR family transcriptional regulator